MTAGLAAAARTALRGVAVFALAASGVASATPLHDCFVAGLRNSVLCSAVQRPLDPLAPAATQITVRYIVVPALARRKLADAVFVIAGGPGQSAVGIAGATLPLLARLNNRRDLVFVDQRGTGGSAPLDCPEAKGESGLDLGDADRQAAFVARCKAALLKLPYIHSERDLGFFTTAIAVDDLEAVRRELGLERINLIAASYGTRVALEYLRRHPGAVRRAVLDGIAPPDMVLPASFSIDNQRALDQLFAACAAETACAQAHPRLAERFDALLASLPRRVDVIEPATGKKETQTMSRDSVLAAVRSALYVPALAAALPSAIEAAASGDFAGLLGLNALFVPRAEHRLSTGMHLSVVCAEDVPRMASTGDAAGQTFGAQFAHQYERLCASWPRGPVPASFYSVGAAPRPVLLLSGGLDPATPPRHGERVAHALGAQARHVVVANAGHGVLGVGCMRDVVFRFFDAAADVDALAVDADCAMRVPRPPAFQTPFAPAGGGTELAR